MVYDGVGLAIFSFPGLHQGGNLSFRLPELFRSGLTSETAIYMAIQLFGVGVIVGMGIPGAGKDE